MRFSKYIAVTGILIMGFLSVFSDFLFASKKDNVPVNSIYDFSIEALDGEEIAFSKYRGKYMLIVNTASKCGYTPQYAELQKLQDMYGEKLHVLGFPANNFLWQEPGTNDDIASFCQKNYGVTFQMFSKVSVKGKDQHPIFAWLKAKTGKSPTWNFCKYLIDQEGKVIAFYPSKVKPLDPEILDKIKL
jgi:glutathione peroxidase